MLVPAVHAITKSPDQTKARIHRRNPGFTKWLLSHKQVLIALLS